MLTGQQPASVFLHLLLIYSWTILLCVPGPGDLGRKKRIQGLSDLFYLRFERGTVFQLMPAPPAPPLLHLLSEQGWCLRGCHGAGGPQLPASLCVPEGLLLPASGGGGQMSSHLSSKRVDFYTPAGSDFLFSGDFRFLHKRGQACRPPLRDAVPRPPPSLLVPLD